MPIPIPDRPTTPLFPSLSKSSIDATRTSSWYSTFEDLSIPTTIISIDKLGEREAFLEWFNSDSIFLPENSGTRSPASARQDGQSSRRGSSSSEGSSSGSEAPVYRLPRLNEAIWGAIDKYGGAVFPKLNWTSPKDAAFIIPQTSQGPLHCTSPDDIYLLLASSDFIPHDLDPKTAYEGCVLSPDDEEVKLELVLRKYVTLDPAREFRCFVRNDVLLGVSQRDANYYDHLQKPETQATICDTIREFWEDEIRLNYSGGRDYIFDLHLDSTFIKPLLLDFSPYRLSTDPLLFDYVELQNLAQTTTSRLPILRTIDSPSHPNASRNAPAYAESMMPFDVQAMGEGRNLAEFREVFAEAVGAGLMGEGGS